MAKKKEECASYMSIEQLLSRERKFIPCTLSLDIALSGGVPLGSTVILGGRQKMGKTTLALQCAANAQRLYGSKVFFLNIEGRLGPQVLSQIQGLDKSEDMFQVINPPEITDKSGELIGYKRWHAEQWWEEIGTIIENNPKSIIIVDSIASMVSEKEASEEIGYQDRGASKKIESQFHRKYGTTIVQQQVALFLLTHIQANTSGYGSPYQAKVGNALKHQADIILFGTTFTKWSETNGKILGQDCVYNVECSANGMPFGKVEVPLRYGFGIDTFKDVITHAVNWDIIQKGGSWYTMPFVETEEEGVFVYKKIEDMDKDDKPVKMQGENSIRNWFLVRPKEKEMIEEKIRHLVLGVSEKNEDV